MVIHILLLNITTLNQKTKQIKKSIITRAKHV